MIRLSLNYNSIDEYLPFLDSIDYSDYSSYPTFFYFIGRCLIESFYFIDIIFDFISVNDQLSSKPTNNFLGYLGSLPVVDLKLNSVSIDNSISPSLTNYMIFDNTFVYDEVIIFNRYD